MNSKSRELFYKNDISNMRMITILKNMYIGWITTEKKLIVVLPLFLLFQPKFVQVASWSYNTHILIAEHGLEKISDFLPELEKYSIYVTSAANAPDIWRDTIEDEGLNHIYYSTDIGRADRAILTWTIYLATELASQPDFSLIARIIGILSHYTADISMPMHCTSISPDYSIYSHEDIDGWLESSDSVCGGVIAIPTFAPEFLPDIYNYTMNQIRENRRVAEEELFPAMQNNDVQRISEIIEKQIERSIIFLVNAVYTAYSQSKETSIEAVMNPREIYLFEIPQLNKLAPIEQRVLVYLLILGIITLCSLYFYRKNRTNLN
jgi:hypothetical protein